MKLLAQTKQIVINKSRSFNKMRGYLIQLIQSIWERNDILYRVGCRGRPVRLFAGKNTVLAQQYHTNHAGPTLDNEPKPTPIHFYVFFSCCKYWSLIYFVLYRMKNVVYVKNISHFNKNKLKYNEIVNKKSCKLWNVQRNMWWANIKTNIKNSNQEK